MLTRNLTNITIKKLQDKNFNDYYVIVNNDNKEEAYFCFKKAVKDGWADLLNNYQNIKEVEIEFEEQEQNSKIYRKVISLWTQGEIIV